jgi:hypothetical protein
MQALLLKVASTRMSREGYKSLDHATRPFRRHQREADGALKMISNYNKDMAGTGAPRIASGKYSMMASQLPSGIADKKKKAITLARAADRGAAKIRDAERGTISSILGATKLHGSRIKENEPSKYLVGQGKKAYSQGTSKAKRSLLNSAKRMNM